MSLAEYTDQLRVDLLEFANRLKIIDTHEHLPPHEHDRIKRDFLSEYLSQYVGSDLISAGMPVQDRIKAMDSSRDLMERWKLVKPYWRNARFSGYGREATKSAEILYGIKQISEETIEELNQRFLAGMDGNAYRRVLKDTCNIETIILDLKDTAFDCDKDYFLTTFRLDEFIFPRSWEDLDAVSAKVGFRICSFDDWLDACEAYFEDALKKGAVCLKMTLAYDRPLFFERVTKAEAEKEFNVFFQHSRSSVWDLQTASFGKKAQDYMMHYALRLANKKGLVYQFHTGLLSGNNGYLPNANPELMANLFGDYPNVKFDIFHIGYPYQHVLSGLAKMFPNVFIDMCWAHVISPLASQNALEEWLDCMPANKICAFGGDSSVLDFVAGHLQIAKENVVQCMMEKIKKNAIDRSDAEYLMQQLFYETPKKLFSL